MIAGWPTNILSNISLFSLARLVMTCFRGHDLQRVPLDVVFFKRERYSKETEENSHHLLAVKPPRSHSCALPVSERLVAFWPTGAAAMEPQPTLDRDCFRGRKFSELWPGLPGSVEMAAASEEYQPTVIAGERKSTHTQCRVRGRENSDPTVPSKQLLPLASCAEKGTSGFSPLPLCSQLFVLVPCRVSVRAALSCKAC